MTHEGETTHADQTDTTALEAELDHYVHGLAPMMASALATWIKAGGGPAEVVLVVGPRVEVCRLLPEAVAVAVPALHPYAVLVERRAALAAFLGSRGCEHCRAVADRLGLPLDEARVRTVVCSAAGQSGVVDLGIEQILTMARRALAACQDRTTAATDPTCTAPGGKA